MRYKVIKFMSFVAWGFVFCCESYAAKKISCPSLYRSAEALKLISILEKTIGEENTKKLMLQEDNTPADDQYVFRIHTEAHQMEGWLGSGFPVPYRGLEKFAQNLDWLARYTESEPSLKDQSQNILYEFIRSGNFKNLIRLDPQTEVFRQYRVLLERYINKTGVIGILLNQNSGAYEVFASPDNMRRLSQNMNFLSQYILSIPSLRNKRKAILSSILNNEGGLWYISQMEFDSKGKPDDLFISFLQDYTGDKRAFIQIIQKEEFTSISSDIGIYRIIRRNIKLFEELINSTPSYEGWGKAMIAESLNTGTFDPEIYFKAYIPSEDFTEIRSKLTL